MMIVTVKFIIPTTNFINGTHLSNIISKCREIEGISILDSDMRQPTEDERQMAEDRGLIKANEDD